MPDLLCSLIRIPPLEPFLEKPRRHGVTLRRPQPWEQASLHAWIAKHFTTGWADEMSVAFHHQPVTGFVALSERKEFVGFAAYECTRRDYFGPTGVLEDWRGRGIGAALFVASLHGLRQLGYTYAVIGAAGPVDFYSRIAQTISIPFEDGRGIYRIAEEPGFEADHDLKRENPSQERIRPQ